VSRDPDRRAFLRLGVAGLVAASPLRALAALGPRGSRPLVGAIRWDAWYAPRDPVTKIPKSAADAASAYAAGRSAVRATFDNPMVEPSRAGLTMSGKRRYFVS